MYIILTLFFVSLFGIIFMIGRKLLMLQNGTILAEEPRLSEEEYWEELRHKAWKAVRITEYAILIGILRLYFKLSNFLKALSKQAIEKIKDAYVKRSSNNKIIEPREVSKFLKMVSEYKRKIKRIKQKVKEEENL